MLLRLSLEFKDYRRVGLELMVLNNFLVDYTVKASREYSKSRALNRGSSLGIGLRKL